MEPLRKVPRLILAAAVVSCLWPGAWAQERDRDRDRDYRDRDRVTRLEPGIVIPIRLLQTVDVERNDNQVYPGEVDHDVRGENGLLAIPRGSRVEMMVRVAPDNDLILNLESVSVNGQRYALRAEPNRVESARDNSIVGAIVGAISGVQVRGRAVRVPRDSVISFRLDRPLEMGVADRGYDRDGRHYHDDRER
jgi:hypothetical protein